MRAAPALLLLISFSACAAAAAAREDAEGKVNTEKAVHTVQEGFASFDMVGGRRRSDQNRELVQGRANVRRRREREREREGGVC